MEAPSPVVLREHGKEAYSKTAGLVVPCFYDDALFRWLFQDTFDETRNKPLATMILAITKTCICGGGFILDANNWGACMAVSRPGQQPDSIPTLLKAGAIPAAISVGIKPTLRLLVHYFAAVDAAKAKVLPREKWHDGYYIFITATEAAHRKKGLLRAIMNDVLERARKDGKHVWLEATSAYSRRQFERMGFEFIEDMVMGKGKVGRDGHVKAGGEGVFVAAMIWRPEGQKAPMAVREADEAKGQET